MNGTEQITILEDKIRVLEEELAAARASNAAKESFLSSMSHDIRTPMNAIVGMTALAKKHIDENTSSPTACRNAGRRAFFLCRSGYDRSFDPCQSGNGSGILRFLALSTGPDFKK